MKGIFVGLSTKLTFISIFFFPTNITGSLDVLLAMEERREKELLAIREREEEERRRRWREEEERVAREKEERARRDLMVSLHCSFPHFPQQVVFDSLNRNGWNYQVCGELYFNEFDVDLSHIFSLTIAIIFELYFSLFLFSLSADYLCLTHRPLARKAEGSAPSSGRGGESTEREGV